ncbi:MAG: type 4a pilus biogenesis protein PilO [Thiofilum sp.]|uniref:type 4a pilus biogenesis protein PilO n=1 Tax=Thiofilum sp. TaxID=2212733 RepID=UPI0025F92331|nr:type 4a pilus biogenesis protein PilO [Thiofilum sp.]MBK8453476.1 type 4a pilus biogenesis protein PilO [Thiofilum sp.]
MKLQDFNYLVEDPASVSWSVKLIALLMVLGFVLFAGYHFMIVERVETLKTVAAKEDELKQTLESRQRRASQLDSYEKQLEEMQNSFGNLLQQLPSSTEIPALIVDISEKGITNGLEIELFEPAAETQKEFYAEKPIKIIALGSYRELAMFVSDISGLPRIVTIHDIKLGFAEDPDKLKDKKNDKNTNLMVNEKPISRLRMEAVIKTYRYLDESVKQKAEKPNSEKKS